MTDERTVADFVDKILAAVETQKVTCVVEAPPVQHGVDERRVTCPHCTYTQAAPYGWSITGFHRCVRDGNTFYVTWGRTRFGGL